MKLAYFMFRKLQFYFQENPLGFFISSCFRLMIISFLHVFVSSDVFIIDSICVVTTSAMDLRECFSLSSVFYLTILSAFIKISLGPAEQPWRLQGLPLKFETQIQSISLFESHSCWQLYGKYGTLFRLVKICW